METRPKLRLFRYLVPVIIILALIFTFRYCGKQEKPFQTADFGKETGRYRTGCYCGNRYPGYPLDSYHA